MTTPRTHYAGKTIRVDGTLTLLSAAAEAGIKCVDQAIQTHGGNGFALEYGVAQLWWGVRIARTAPVSREMILNYVAEHSLGLPKSY